MNEYKDLSAQKFTPKRSKWCIIGHTEISNSQKCIRMWFTSNFNVRDCYIGIDDLKALLSGHRKMIHVFIRENNLGR